jgi:hypothetical protein
MSQPRLELSSFGTRHRSSSLIAPLTFMFLICNCFTGCSKSVVMLSECKMFFILNVDLFSSCLLLLAGPSVRPFLPNLINIRDPREGIFKATEHQNISPILLINIHFSAFAWLWTKSCLYLHIFMDFLSGIVDYIWTFTPFRRTLDVDCILLKHLTVVVFWTLFVSLYLWFSQLWLWGVLASGL